MKPITLSILLAFTIGCKQEQTAAPQGSFKKVESGAAGLPSVEPPARAREETAPGQGGGRGGEMPDDQVHRGAGAGHGLASDSETDAAELPLKKAGMGSAAELARALARVKSAEDRPAFEEAFRKTFCTDKSRRDLKRAREVFDGLLKRQPDLAEAYRGLAYVALSDGFNLEEATRAYSKAIELRPDYGEAHYALASLYAMTDRARGGEHFRKAMQAGIADEQRLAGTYLK